MISLWKPVSTRSQIVRKFPQQGHAYTKIIFPNCFSMGKIEPTKMTWFPAMFDFIAQLVEHRTGIHRGHRFKSY